MAEGSDEVLGRLLVAMQKAKPQARILILDLPGDTKLRQVACGPVEGGPAGLVQLSIVVDSVDSLALQEIAKRLTATAEASEALLAARAAAPGE